MLGKTPESIVACRPMRDGVIADFELTESMLRYFIREVHDNRRTFVSPRMIIGVPSGITQVERRAVKILQSKQVRAKSIYYGTYGRSNWCRAYRCMNHRGSMIVDIGGGTTEVAVIHLKMLCFADLFVLVVMKWIVRLCSM